MNSTEFAIQSGSAPRYAVTISAASRELLRSAVLTGVFVALHFNDPTHGAAILSSNIPTKVSAVRILASILLCLLLLSPHIAGRCQAAESSIDYVRDIQPLLADSCFTCHGPDEESRQADLRLDNRDVAVASAITPGDAEASELIARVTSDDPELQMPPPDSRRPRLSVKQVKLLSKWIDEGANYQTHWAYVTPVRPPVPQLPPELRVSAANPIDHFVLERLHREGIQSSPSADTRTQIRRLAFDLTGLPPSSDLVSAFSAQLDSTSAYRTLVNRFLSQPAFAERMTAYWLDVVRYGDSVGIHGDQLVSMSPYRDYVLKAFHENMPFDQFLREQLAGDLLPQATLDQQIASAFNRLHMITAEGGAQPKEYLAIYSADRVRNTAAALLGTTLGCCQCHDHKFDPFQHA